jgi:S-disulfanyl-L-cysteine oxidoreductase SoxD
MSRLIRVLPLVAWLGCTPAPEGSPSGDSARGQVRAAADPPASFAIGRAASAEEIAAWDLDVNPAGVGLPPGSGTAQLGNAVYIAKCAACHGPRGEGVAPNPPIVGREPKEGFPFAQSLGHTKTVGNYWPYATTIYDYLRRAMPQDRPGSLTPNELYALTAWILTENGIIQPDQVVDARSLPGIEMPARGRFVRDDRPSSVNFR